MDNGKFVFGAPNQNEPPRGEPDPGQRAHLPSHTSPPCFFFTLDLPEEAELYLDWGYESRLYEEDLLTDTQGLKVIPIRKGKASGMLPGPSTWPLWAGGWGRRWVACFKPSSPSVSKQ